MSALSLDDLKRMGIELPEGISLEELQGALDGAITEYSTEPVYIMKDQTKTCLRCGKQFAGRQRYYPGYEGDFTLTDWPCCPYCVVDSFEHLKEHLWNTRRFELKEVTDGV